MHHHRRDVEKDLEGEVAVAHRVEAVDARCVEAQRRGRHLAVDVVRCARQRGTAQRRDVVAAAAVDETLDVAFEHGSIRQHVVAEVDRLGVLQVRHARDQRFGVLLRDVDDHFRHLFEQLGDLEVLAKDVTAEVDRHLVVAAARRVQLAARFADDRRQAVLDRHVQVFVADLTLELARLDLLEYLRHAVLDGFELFGRKNALLFEHRRMRQRALDVLAVEAAVEHNRRVEFIQQ